ncbi:MAG: hypothetical protein ACRDBP_17710 [Luteolibacter sp.]
MRLRLPFPFAALSVRLFGLAVAALAALSPITSRAQTGSTDPTFGATFRGGFAFLASAIQPDGRVEGTDFVIRFTAPAGLGGITYGTEFSTTLQPGSFAVVPDTGIAPEYVFRVPMGARTRMFMQILVTRH